MSTYEPGTVAMVTFEGKACRAMRTGTPSNMGWEVVRGDGSKTWCSDGSRCVTDIRPCVVLDMGFGSYPGEEAVRLLRTAAFDDAGFRALLKWLADQIEAQTKPPRIDEPTEPLTEVMASTEGRERRKFIRGYQGATGVRYVDGVSGWAWDELIDPILVRGGVES